MNMNLPQQPGLQRRLAYSNYIRQRQQLRRNTFTDTLQVQGFSLDLPISYQDMEVFTDKQTTVMSLINNSRILYQSSKFFCTICQDIFSPMAIQQDSNEGVVIRQLKCNHKYHIECIEKWLSNNKTCPMCRYLLID